MVEERRTTMTLKELNIGESAVIETVGGQGALRQHFLDMGLIPGEKVTLVKFAPMGDPMELQIHGYALTLRLDDAARINVSPAKTVHSFYCFTDTSRTNNKLTISILSKHTTKKQLLFLIYKNEILLSQVQFSYFCLNFSIMKISIDHNSAIPLYLQIENQLRNIIREPEYKKGKMLPNEVDLSKQLGISRNTLRQAINNLVTEGLLVRKKGIGTIVVNQSVSSKAKNWLSFTQEMKAQGIEPTNYELHTSWALPSEEICRFFSITDEKKILKLERLRGNPEFPFVYFISYFNPRIGLTGNEDFSRPLYEILEQDYSSVAKISKEEISAQLADKFLAQKLEIKPGDAILIRKRFVYDPGGRPLEWNIGYYRADSFVYTLEFEREV